MPGEIELSCGAAAQQFGQTARRLRQAGNKELRAELYAGINRAVKPLRTNTIPQSARDTLPHTGGLGELVATSKISVQRRTSGASVGIRLIGTSGHDIAAIDRGRVRKPLFGDKRHWYTQMVRLGWWSNPTGESEPDVRAEVVAVIDRVTRKIEG